MSKYLRFIPAAFLTAFIAAAAQSPLRPAYDSISVKPNYSASTTSSYDFNESVLVAKNTSLYDLLALAYGIKPGLIYGLDESVGTQRFNITAIRSSDTELPKDASYSGKELLLQSLLAGEFQLSAHTTDRSLLVYELRRAGGEVKFQPASADVGVREPGDQRLWSTNTSMPKFAEWLTFQTHRIVMDETGLDRRYDLRVNMPAEPRSHDGPEGYGRVDPHPLSETGWASLNASLQGELGLKLQPAERTVKTLTVDQVILPGR